MTNLHLNISTKVWIFILLTTTISAQYSEPQTLFSTPLADIQDYQLVDFNSDQVMDLVVNTGSVGGDYTYFLKGVESGFEIEKKVQFDNTISEMIFFDFDGDSDLDLLSGKFIFENKDLEFAKKTNLTGIDFSNITIYDIDNDGDSDIIPGIASLDQIIRYPYFQNNGNFDFTLTGDIPDSYFPAQVKIADLNNDGVSEIIRAISNELYVHALVDTNNLEYFEFDNSINYDKIETGDINGDGIVEFIVLNEEFLTAYIFDGVEFEPKNFYFQGYFVDLILYDHNKDEIQDIVIYNRGYQFISYMNEELVLERSIMGPEEVSLSSKCIMYRKDGKQKIVRAGHSSIKLFELNAENLIEDGSLLEDFTTSYSPIAYTNDNSNLNYAFIDGSTMSILKIDPSNHQKIIESIQLKSRIRSASLVELENGKPVYLISYIDDPGLYILNAHHPTTDQINNAKMLFTNPPVIHSNKVDKSISVILTDGLDILRLTFDNDYKIEYLRSMSNPPSRIMEADLNNDGRNDILWVSNYSMWYSEKLSNGYGDFTKLEIEDDFYFFPNINLFDIDDDDEIEIVNAGSSEVKVWNSNSNFELEETSYDIEGAWHIQFTGNLNENTISLLRNNGRLSIINDFSDFLNSGNTDIDLIIEPHLSGSTFFRDLDNDGDRDIVIRNFYSLSVSLYSDMVSVFDNAEKFTIFPNPTNGVLNFSLENNPQIISIHDAYGKSYPTDNDLSGFPPGAYFVKLKIQNEFQIIQVLKI